MAMDIKELINKILLDSGIQKSKNFETKIYQDEPILRTASQMDHFIPTQCREMRKLANDFDPYRHSDSWLFYKQGKFMEEYEDEYEYHGEFVRYFPTYQSMNDFQLRGYFSWRTKVRKGVVEKTSLSFVYVYIYEILNQIGVKSPEEGFEVLRGFWSVYRKIEPQIDRYIKLWLSDYVVYYNLSSALLEELPDNSFEKAASVLFHEEKHSAQELFDALMLLSSYRLENSKFYREYQDDMKNVVSGVYVSLSEYYRKNRKNSLFEHFLGKVVSAPYYMFSSAVFYDRMKCEDREYIVNDIRQYECRDGKWTCRRMLGNGGTSRELGAMIKAIDCRMRERYEYKSPLKPEKTTKILSSLIEKEIDRWLETKRKNTAPKIVIDTSKLQGIRIAASITRDKLIVEEDIEENPVEVKMTEPAAEEKESILTEIEERFLCCLLNEEAYEPLLKENGMMLSVLVDTINEKLFDQFSDTVIVFEDEVPELIEDYREELKGLLEL